MRRNRHKPAHNIADKAAGVALALSGVAILAAPFAAYAMWPAVVTRLVWGI